MKDKNTLLPGTRIKFIRDITEAANEEHPDIIFAKEGDMGKIVSIGSCWEGYVVKWDAPFGASLDIDFIPI
jgi:hypothetical protein